jgi:hypothetical protein
MDDKQIDDRFDCMEKHLGQGFEHLQALIDTLATTCVPEFASINEHFTRVDSRLAVIDGKIEAFARRIDGEVEARHVLGERISKLEQTH